MSQYVDLTACSRRRSLQFTASGSGRLDTCEEKRDLEDGTRHGMVARRTA